MHLEIRFRPWSSAKMRQFKLVVRRTGKSLRFERNISLPATDDTIRIRRQMTGYARYRRWWRWGLDILLEHGE